MGPTTINPSVAVMNSIDIPETKRGLEYPRRWSIWIGYDPRETDAYLVTCASIRRYWPDAPIQPLVLSRLQVEGFYQRPWRREGSRLVDVISDAPMSTEFAISRFLVSILAGS